MKETKEQESQGKFGGEENNLSIDYYGWLWLETRNKKDEL